MPTALKPYICIPHIKMPYKYIYKPPTATVEQYDRVVDLVCKKIKKQPGVLAIYQFGHLNTPGISDIDILTVFDKGSSCLIDPLDGCPDELKKLFTHSVQGISAHHLEPLMKYSFWHNYNLLYSAEGKDILPASSISKEIIIPLKQQIATEYLTTNYIDMVMQQSIGIIKVRSLFQHVKGFIYDFDFLGYDDPALRDKVETVRGWIKQHNHQPVSDREIGTWLDDFMPTFKIFLQKVYETNPLYLPKRDIYNYGRNIKVIARGPVQCKHTGFRVPRIPGIMTDKQFYRLQNRFNNFEFHFPITHQEPFPGASDRIKEALEMRTYCKLHIPHFAPLLTRFMLQL